MLTAVIILAGVALVAVSGWIFIKLDLRSIRRDLEGIMKSGSNAKITTQTFDADITRLAKQINALLEEQKQAAIAGEKISKELRQAVTNISHDLKTPLTSALGYLQMVQASKTPPEKKAEYLEIIQKRLQALSGLLEELFAFSQIYEGKIDLHYEKVNAANLLGDVLSLYYEDFTEKNITPVVHFPKDPVYLFADAAMLKRVFQNLIQNALVHGMYNFSVVLEPGARIVFTNSIENAGQVDVERMFDRFYTADPAAKRQTTGLGLAICKELIESQEGTIQARIEDHQLVISIDLREIQ